MQQVELMVAVDDDRGPGAICGLQVLDALVVAQEVDAVGWKVGLQREMQLARGDDVEAQPLVGDHAEETGRGKGFGRVKDLPRAVHRRHVFGRTLADGCLVVDVERGTVAAGELDEVAAAHVDVAGSIDPVRDREKQL